jgi:hypothetical protein
VKRRAMQGKPRIPPQIRALARRRHRPEPELPVSELALDARDPRDPSARNVAIVLCLPASNSRPTRAANSGSARSTSFHAATAAVCARSSSVHRHLSSLRDIAITELGDRLAVPGNPAGRAARAGSGDTDALGGRGRMARIGRLHHERPTDRVSWPKRELQGNRFPVPGICRVHNWVLCARRAVDLARLRATQNRRSDFLLEQWKRLRGVRNKVE